MEKKIYEMPVHQQAATIQAMVSSDEFFVAKFFTGLLAGFVLGLLTRLVF